MELQPVMDVMSRHLQGYEFHTKEDGSCKLSVTIKQLMLNAGKYNVSAIILSKDLKVLCRHDNAISVIVQANCASGANIILPAEWQTLSLESPRT
jgi:hypothetical protein